MFYPLAFVNVLSLFTLFHTTFAAVLPRQVVFPQCAQTCLATANYGGCDIADNNCLCSTEVFLTSSNACFLKICQGADLVTALSGTTALCAAAGVTVTYTGAATTFISATASTTPSSTSSSTSSNPVSTTRTTFIPATTSSSISVSSSFIPLFAPSSASVSNTSQTVPTSTSLSATINVPVTLPTITPRPSAAATQAIVRPVALAGGLLGGLTLVLLLTLAFTCFGTSCLRRKKKNNDLKEEMDSIMSAKQETRTSPHAFSRLSAYVTRSFSVHKPPLPPSAPPMPPPPLRRVSGVLEVEKGSSSRTKGKSRATSSFLAATEGVEDLQ